MSRRVNEPSLATSNRRNAFEPVRSIVDPLPTMVVVLEINGKPLLPDVLLSMFVRL